MHCRAPFRHWIGLSDIEKVLSACGKHGVAVEINAHPRRLDLNWRWHQAALGFGCMMSINPDARSIPELDYMHWGVEMARRGRSALKRAA
jgi:DNA polymerase (family 10)